LERHSPSWHSARKEPDPPDPIFGIRGQPDQEQFFDCRTDIEILRDKDQPWAGLSRKESSKVARHCSSIMGYQDAAGHRCDSKDLGIGYTDDASVECAHNIYRRLSSAEPNYDFVIEIGISLETWPHARVICI
jgi:hypothetical protein